TTTKNLSMPYDLPDILFFKFVLRDSLENMRQQALASINAIDGDRLLNSATDDLIAGLVEEYSVEIPTLLTDQAYLDPVKESKTEINDYDRIIHIPVNVYDLHVPFIGDGNAFHARPSKFTMNPPRALIENKEVILRVTGRDLQSQQIKQNFDASI